MRCKLMVALLLAAQMTGPAMAQDAKSETCDLAAALEKGTDVTIGQLLQIARLWPEADRAKLDAVFRPELEGFTLEKGDVYHIADFGDLAQEYLIVAADRSRAQNIYFRLIFQTYEKGHFFKNVKFNTDFYKITDPAFVQKPQLVSCS